jgi:hypothetical protein
MINHLMISTLTNPVDFGGRGGLPPEKHRNISN